MSSVLEDSLKQHGCALFSNTEITHYNALPDVFTRTLAVRGPAARGSIFRVDGDAVYAAFLQSLGPELAPQFKCHCCRNFIKRACTLVTINEDLSTTSLVLDENAIPQSRRLYAPVIRAMRIAVESADIVAAATWVPDQPFGAVPAPATRSPKFTAAKPTAASMRAKAQEAAALAARLAKPNGSKFSHWYCSAPAKRPAPHAALFPLNPHEVVPSTERLRYTAQAAITAYSQELLAHAEGLLESGEVHAAAKLQPQLSFLREMRARVGAMSAETLAAFQKVERARAAKADDTVHHADYREKAERLSRLLWRAAATAPPGWCCPKNTLLGAFLDEIGQAETAAAKASGAKATASWWSASTTGKRAGKVPPAYDTAINNLNTRTRGDNYMRSTKAVTEGAAGRAEAIFEQLGLARALPRRIAFLDEVPLMWRPSKSVYDDAADDKAHNAVAAEVAAAPEPEPADAKRGGDKGKSKGKSGVFGFLLDKNNKSGNNNNRDAGAAGNSHQSQPLAEPAARHSVPMSFSKFARKVLPSAARLFVECAAADYFATFTAPVHDDAPPLYAWDCSQEEADAAARAVESPTDPPARMRNPLASYTYLNPRAQPLWGMQHGQGQRARTPGGLRVFRAVTGIANRPALLGTPSGAMDIPDKPSQMFFFLRGCRETVRIGAGIFPEHVRAELHSVRSVVEAASKQMKMQLPEDTGAGAPTGPDGRAREQAAGLQVNFESRGRQLRVIVEAEDGACTEYTLEHWE